LEAVCQSSPLTRRPVPDVARLLETNVDLKAIVTHPPLTDPDPVPNSALARPAV